MVAEKAGHTPNENDVRNQSKAKGTRTTRRQGTKSRARKSGKRR